MISPGFHFIVILAATSAFSGSWSTYAASSGTKATTRMQQLEIAMAETPFPTEFKLHEVIPKNNVPQQEEVRIHFVQTLETIHSHVINILERVLVDVRAQLSPSVSRLTVVMNFILPIKRKKDRALSKLKILVEQLLKPLTPHETSRHKGLHVPEDLSSSNKETSRHKGLHVPEDLSSSNKVKYLGSLFNSFAKTNETSRHKGLHVPEDLSSSNKVKYLESLFNSFAKNFDIKIDAERNAVPNQDFHYRLVGGHWEDWIVKLQMLVGGATTLLSDKMHSDLIREHFDQYIYMLPYWTKHPDIALRQATFPFAKHSSDELARVLRNAKHSSDELLRNAKHSSDELARVLRIEK